MTMFGMKTPGMTYDNVLKDDAWYDNIFGEDIWDKAFHCQ